MPVVVDPKGEDYSGYRGATLITPNRREFEQVAGRFRDKGQDALIVYDDLTKQGLSILADCY